VYTAPDVASAIAACGFKHGHYWDLESYLFSNTPTLWNAKASDWPPNSFLEASALKGCLVDGSVLRSFLANVAEIQALAKDWLRQSPAFIVTRRMDDGRVISSKFQGDQELHYMRAVINKMREM
jgi:hypothetical protein